MRAQEQFEYADVRITRWMDAHGVTLLRVAVGIVSVWIGVGLIVLTGLGILTGVSKAKRPDPPEQP